MSLYQWPYCLSFELHSPEVARPDGPVALPIDGNALLKKAGATGVLDVQSLRVVDMNAFPHDWGTDSVERDCAVQFEPADDFHPTRNPSGTLWFRLYKYTWEDKTFPRHFRLYFDTIRGGGKPTWQGRAEPLLPPVSLTETLPGGLAWHQEGITRLGFSAPWGAKPGFHPVTTPHGRTLTADHPCDHLWHHGLCFGWTNLECEAKQLPQYTYWGEPGAGFWPQGGPERKQCGPVLSSFRQRVIMGTQSGDPVLTFDLEARYQPIDQGWDWLDLKLTFTAEDAPVKMTSSYGHIKARINLAMTDPVLIDSDGQEHREGHRPASPVDWIGVSGRLDGSPASMLILNHPDNPGGRPSGDGSADLRNGFMDMGDRFTWLGLNPLRIEPLLLEAGQTLVWHYRVVTTDRMLDKAFGDFHYHNWATAWTIRWV
jgi:hypothetical protein